MLLNENVLICSKEHIMKVLSDYVTLLKSEANESPPMKPAVWQN